MPLLIIDTNVVFAFSKAPKVVDLIEGLIKAGVKLVTPQFCLDELVNVRDKLMKYAGFSENEFKAFIKEIKKAFFVVPKLLYEDFIEEAELISPHKKDVPLFALSLAFNKVPIWSREPRLKRQRVVKVLSDKDVEEYFGLESLSNTKP